MRTYPTTAPVAEIHRKVVCNWVLSTTLGDETFIAAVSLDEAAGLYETWGPGIEARTFSDHQAASEYAEDQLNDLFAAAWWEVQP